MNKISICLLFLVFVQNTFCQNTYWSCKGFKNIHETYKTAFVTTKDQDDQFIVKHDQNGYVELLFITDQNLFEKSIVYFQFDGLQNFVQGNIKQIDEGVFRFVPFMPGDDKMFIRINDKVKLKIDDIINYLKKYSKLHISINSSNQYTTKEFNYYFTLKESTKYLTWALSENFDWDSNVENNSN